MILLITNRKLVPKFKFLTVLGEAARSGIDAIMLREKDLDKEELLTCARQIKSKVIKDKRILFIVNSNLQVAQTIQAAGYHCSFSRFAADGPVYAGLNGVSVHSVEEALAAEKMGANYLLVGHIFATNCKPDLKPKGISLVKEIKTRVKIPVIALGGINADNAGSVVAAGADGVAVMSFIMQARDPFAAGRQLYDILTQG